MKLKSYVINLERANDRRQRAIAEQEKLGFPFEVVDAVDGQDATGDFTDEGYTLEAGKRLRNMYHTRGLSRNEQACALSHIRVYGKILQDDVDVALVCEDDAAFRCSGHELMELFESMPRGWELLYLYHQGDILPFGPRLVRFSSVPGFAVCYAVTRQGAQRLLELAFPLRLAADAFLGRATFIGIIDGYGAFPLLAEHRDEGYSYLDGNALPKKARRIKEYLSSRYMLARRLAYLFGKKNSYFCWFW